MWHGSRSRVLVQETRLVPFVWWSPHVRALPRSPASRIESRPAADIALSSSAKIVVIFQVSEVHVMRKKNRSLLLMSLLSTSLLVGMFTIVQAQNSAAPAAKATNWSDPATWPNRKVPVAGDKVIIEKGKQVVLDVTPPALNGLTIE